MDNKRGKGVDPSRLVGWIIGVAVLAVLVIVLWSALKSKREYDAERAQTAPASHAPGTAQPALSTSGVARAGH